MKKILVSVMCLAALSGCSSIIEGTSQEIMINTNPPGADCALERQNLVVARVNPTPAAATIKKTKHDITVRCNKAGYQEATYFNKSGSAGATFGNIVLGGGIGWAVDSAAGADNKYDSPVNITLVPSNTLAAATPVAASDGTVAPIASPLVPATSATVTAAPAVAAAPAQATAPVAAPVASPAALPVATPAAR